MSIDFSPYVNLRIYDKDPMEVYLSAVELMQMNVPQLSVRPGTIEDGMIQAFSFLTTIAINHMNAIPDRLAEALATFMGIERFSSSFASVPLRVTALDYSGGTLDSETTLEYKYTDGAGQDVREYYELPIGATIEPVEPVLGANPPTPLPYVDVIATAVGTGARRAITEGTELLILNSQSVSDSATALTGFVQGGDEEDDASFLSRFGTFLQSMTSTSATAKQVESYVLSNFPFVGRVKAYDLTNGLSNRNIGAADVPGFVTLYVYGNGRALTEFEKLEVYNEVRERMLAGITLVVEDIKILTATVNVTVRVSEFADSVAIATSVKTKLATTLTPALYPFNDPAIRKTALLAQVTSVPLVLFVEAMTVTCDETTSNAAGDLLFGQKGCLPELSIDNITVTANLL